MEHFWLTKPKGLPRASRASVAQWHLSCLGGHRIPPGWARCCHLLSLTASNCKEGIIMWRALRKQLGPPSFYEPWDWKPLPAETFWVASQKVLRNPATEKARRPILKSTPITEWLRYKQGSLFPSSSFWIFTWLMREETSRKTLEQFILPDNPTKVVPPG